MKRARPPRIFLLSPAYAGGLRAQMVLSERAQFDLAQRLRNGAGATLGEVFTFLSGLYFRGKLAYGNAFAGGPGGVLVITPTRGLLPADTPVSIADLKEFATVDIHEDDARYRKPLARDAKKLAKVLPPDGQAVLLGSIATAKYVDVLMATLKERLVFPKDFVGRGDMSRGGLLLRCAADRHELDYVPVAGAVLHGSRPPKLEPRRYPKGWPFR